MAGRRTGGRPASDATSEKVPHVNSGEEEYGFRENVENDRSHRPAHTDVCVDRKFPSP